MQIISLSETFFIAHVQFLAKTGLQLQYKQNGNPNPHYTMDRVKRAF